MNAEKLGSLLTVINPELSYLSGNLGAVSTLLNSVASNPGNVDAQKEYKLRLDKVNSQLAEAESNFLPPHDQMLLTTLGIREYLGDPLRKKIREVLDQNLITPAVASENIGGILFRINGIFQSASKIAEGFTHLGIEHDDLNENKCELACSFPTAFVKGDFRNFVDLLKNLEQILSKMSELQGHVGDYKIAKVSSSDFTVFIVAGFPVAIAMAHLVEKTVIIYEHFLHAKLLRKQLEKIDLPNKGEIVAPLNKSIKDAAKKEVEKAVKELLKEMPTQSRKKMDKGRESEISGHMSRGMQILLSWVDEGVAFSIRTPEIDENTEAEDDGQSQKNLDAVEELDRINEKLVTSRIGEARKLGLPDLTDDDSDDESSKDSD